MLPKILLILLLGTGQPEPTGQARPQPIQPVEISASALVDVHLDLTAFRRVALANPKLKKWFYGGKEPAAAYDEALKMAGTFNLDPALIKKAALGVTAIRFRLLGIGRSIHNTRFLLTLERPGQEPILPQIIPTLRAMMQQGVGESRCGNTTVYSLTSRRGEGIWLAELDDALLVTPDPIELRRFLYKAKDKTPAPQASTPPAPADDEKGTPFLRVTGHGVVLWRTLLSMTRRYDLDEVLITDSIFDLAALKKLTLTYDGSRIKADLPIHGQSPLIKLLEGPGQTPGLLQAIPADTAMACLLAVRHGDRIYPHVERVIHALAPFEGGKPGPELMARLNEEFTDEVGLDLKADICENAAAAAWVVDRLHGERDLFRRGALLFEARDKERLHEGVYRFVKAVDREDTVPEKTETGLRANMRRAKIEVSNTRGFFAERRGEETKPIADLGATTGKIATFLTTRYPKANAYFYLNLTDILGKGENIPPLSAGFTMTPDGLQGEMDLPFAALIDLIMVPALANARIKALRAQATSQAKQIMIACHTYAAEHKGALPTELAALKPYLGEKGKVLTCPLSKKPFVFFEAVAGKKIGTLTPPHRVPVVYSPANPAGGAIGYLDGHVNSFTGPQYGYRLPQALQALEREAKEREMKRRRAEELAQRKAAEEARRRAEEEARRQEEEKPDPRPDEEVF